MKVSETGIRVQLSDEEGRRLLTLGPDQISVHLLRPYSSWEAFRALIFEALRVYREVAAPEAVRRIGLRYINKIDLPETTVTLSDYFTKPPLTPDAFPDPMIGLAYRSEGLYDENTRLIYNFSSLPADDDAQASQFLIDIDVVWSGEELVEEKDIARVLEDLRKKEREAFEALITDRTREVFDERSD